MALRAPSESRASGDEPRATSLRSGLRTVLAYAETRARLAANEFEEQVLRLLEVALWAAIGLFLFAVGLVFVAFFIVLLFWDTNRLLAAALVSGVFVAGGVVSVLMVRAGLAARPKFLAATIAEFQKDRQKGGGAMIRERLIALRERRAQLLAEARTQREQVFTAFDKADRVAAWVDRGRIAGRTALSHPLWIAAGVAFVVALRPGRAFKLAATGLSLWRGYRKVRAMIDQFVPVPARGNLF